MRGWGRGASSGAVILRHAIDDPRPAWGPSALVLRAMITMDHERGEGRALLAERLPPRGEALPATVPGPGRGHAGPQPGIQRRQEEASGCHGRPRRHIAVGGSALPPRLPTAGQGPNVARRLGIPRHPPAVVRRVRAGLARRHRLAAGLGWRDGVCGGLCATCRGECPRACRVLVSVCPVGRVASGSPCGAIRWRRTAAALHRGDSRAVRHGGAVWRWLAPRAVLAARRGGPWSATRCRPRAAKASRPVTPRAHAWGPVRRGPRLQPQSRAARRGPPGPSAVTVRAIQRRRARPWRDGAVCAHRVISAAVHAIEGSSACDGLEYRTQPGIT